MSLSLTLDFTYLSLLSFPLNLGKGLSTFVSLKNKRILSLLISILYFYIFFSFFHIFNFYLFIFGCAGPLLLCRLFSSYDEWGLLSNCGVRASLCLGFLLLWSVSSRPLQLQQLWRMGSRASAQQLGCTGLVALWHVRCSWTRD